MGEAAEEVGGINGVGGCCVAGLTMGEATGNGGILGFPKNNQGANNSGGVGATALGLTGKFVCVVLLCPAF